MKLFFCLNLLILSTSLLAAPTYPKWGKLASSTVGGEIYNVEMSPKSSGMYFSVEYRPILCETVKVSNPKCSYEYSVGSLEKDSKIYKSTFNAYSCEPANYVELILTTEKILLFDTKAAFISHLKKLNTQTTTFENKTVRFYSANVSDPDCFEVK